MTEDGGGRPKAKFWRRKIRALDGSLLSSPRFPRTPEGRQAADKWYHDRLIEKKLIAEGIELPIQPMRLDVFTRDEWMPRYRLRVEEPTWREDQAKLILRILPKFGPRLMHTIRQGDVEDFLGSLLAEGLSPATSDHYRSLLSRIFNAAIRHNPAHMKTNPVTGIKPYSKYDHRKKPKVWTAEQCERYLAEARRLGPIYYLLMTFYVNTGARQSEIIALRHEDIDPERAQFTIRRVRERVTGNFRPRTKSGHERTLGMNEAVANAYRAWLRELSRRGAPAQPEDLIFTRQVHRKGKPWSAMAVDYWHHKILSAAGLPRITPHGLRHTFASLFISATGNMRSLQGMIGHSSARMSERYTHFVPGQLQSQAGVVEISAGRRSSRRRAAGGGKRQRKVRPL